MLPVAIACSAVAMRIAIVALIVCARIASCAASASVITSGSGPSSRIEPVSTNGILCFTHSYMIPSVMIPCSTALAIDPARAHHVDRAHVQPVTALRDLAGVRHAERRAVDRRLDVVHGDGVSGEQRADVAVGDEPAHVRARARMDERRSGDPHRIAAALLLLDEQARHVRVVDRLFARHLARHEGERVRIGAVRHELRLHEDAVAAVFLVADGDEVALARDAALRAPRARRPCPSGCRRPSAARAAQSSGRSSGRTSAGSWSRRTRRAGRRRPERARIARRESPRTAQSEKSGGENVVTQEISPSGGVNATWIARFRGGPYQNHRPLVRLGRAEPMLGICETRR